jgi:hypothetical protein
MSKLRFSINILATTAFLLMVTSMANAQSRTWVSGVGDDLNPCSRTAPCKTFAGAISKTAANGEIDCLDPGGFGTVTITKSITIDGTHGGGFGSILSAGTNGINVNDSATASPNTIIVVLRNLSIQGAGTGFDGIRFVSGKTVHVENCVISGMRGNGTNSDGIEVALTAGTGQRLYVKNTKIEDNTGDGIKASNTAGASTVQVIVEDSIVSTCNDGITSGTNSKFILNRSSFLGNSVTGVGAAGGSQGIELESCLMQGNSNGLAVVAGTSRIANCRITNNTNGIVFAGGVVQTFGDNKVFGNTTADQSGGTVTAVPPPAKI